MSLPTHPAVLVMGADPAGLIAALTLNKNGVPTRIVELRDSFHGGICGTISQPPCIELLASLGVLDEILKISDLPYTIGVHGAGNEIRCGFNVNQSVFERVLQERLEKEGAAVEIDVELVGIEQSASAVRARLLVGGN